MSFKLAEPIIAPPGELAAVVLNFSHAGLTFIPDSLVWTNDDWQALKATFAITSPDAVAGEASDVVSVTSGSELYKNYVPNFTVKIYSTPLPPPSPLPHGSFASISAT